jgi:murein L,D-transpeptidase YcbB/YkuD
MKGVSMRTRKGAALFLAAFLLFSQGALSAQHGRPEEAPILSRLERVALSRERVTSGERLIARNLLEDFYAARSLEPAWLEGGVAEALSRLGRLRQAIGRSADHGLEPAEYHLEALERLHVEVESGQPSPDELADLELLASDAFILLAADLLGGRVARDARPADWAGRAGSVRLDRALAEALASGRIAEVLDALAPQDARYWALVDASRWLRSVVRAGGWPVVPEGPPLELGHVGVRVVLLRARLEASGDLEPGFLAPADVFDTRTLEAVRRFQTRHGLAADGVVGPTTLAALNVPAGERLAQVAANLERWRWLPADLGEPRIEVNIPAFELRVVERGESVRRHRVIVGRKDRKTPLISGTIGQVVLSPSWTVPRTVAAEDLLPEIRKDPGLLAARRMTLLERATRRPVDLASVDWATISAVEFNERYLLHQAPGPLNALRNVKLPLSNARAIYLHDTPAQELFQRPLRTFSSGCVRVENALDLAGYLLADRAEWTRDRIEAVAASGRETSASLTREIPVHLVYWTAWVEGDGELHFRQDVYGHDRIVRRALLGPRTVR